MRAVPTGRLFAYLGVIVGLGISIAANFAHAAARPAAPWWAPYLSAAWPLLLFLALEILTRVAWTGRGVLVARGGVATVAAVAASLSYSHLRDLLVTQAGERPWAATVGPLAIDGIMAISAAALLTTSRAATHHGGDAAQEGGEQPTGTPTTASHQPVGARPTGPVHSVSPQVTAGDVPGERPRAPVSQAALDAVLRALRSGQPMSKAQLVEATGLGRSTVSRAVDHLLTGGLLMSAVGVDARRPKDPYYSLIEAGVVPDVR